MADVAKYDASWGNVFDEWSAAEPEDQDDLREQYVNDFIKIKELLGA